MRSLVIIIIAASTVAAQQWRPTGGSRQSNISGLALMGQEDQKTTLLAVHDNKRQEQIHASVISVTGSDAPLITPLKWTNDVGLDIEAVSTVPGLKGQFIAFTAAGRAYHIKIDLGSLAVEVIKSFDVPMIPKDADFEAFDLQKVNGSLTAVWAERGSPKNPSAIFWSKFDLDGYRFTEVGAATFRVPLPVNNVRHISDLKVDTTGAIFVTSASDPGNDGPFSSAFYFAGVLRSDEQARMTFARSTFLMPIFRFEYQKVEAFEFVSGSNGGIVFGTDNENLGSSIFLTF